MRHSLAKGYLAISSASKRVFIRVGANVKSLPAKRSTHAVWFDVMSYSSSDGFSPTRTGGSHATITLAVDLFDLTAFRIWLSMPLL